jgi:hypothetical protein
MRIVPTEDLPAGALVAYGEDATGEGIMLVQRRLITEAGALAVAAVVTARDRYYRRWWPHGARP